jgi:hypothetical protein
MANRLGVFRNLATEDLCRSLVYIGDRVEITTTNAAPTALALIRIDPCLVRHLIDQAAVVDLGQALLRLMEMQKEALEGIPMLRVPAEDGEGEGNAEE